MRKAGFVFVVLLTAELGLALGQEIPKPPPEDNPNAKVLADHQAFLLPRQLPFVDD